MYGALLVFDADFIHVVSISFSALIVTELIMVAMTVHTWHWAMLLAQVYFDYFMKMSIPILIISGSLAGTLYDLTHPIRPIFRSTIRPFMGFHFKNDCNHRCFMSPIIYCQGTSTQILTTELCESQLN